MNSKLLHAMDEQQVYVVKVKGKKDTQYNCYKAKLSGCPAKLYIDKITTECFRKQTYNEPHSHGSMRQEIAEMQLKTKIKKNCGDAATLASHIGSSGSGNVRGIFQHCLAT